MKTARLDLIGDTAVRLLVERGMRGLTHRAVDETAGLPAGSTSYYARTRAALLELALARMTVLEAGEFAPLMTGTPLTKETVADLVATIVHAAIHTGRDQKLARYELALEATRRPELRTVYDEAGRPFREAAIAMAAALGSPTPDRHGRFMIAFCEGIMFDSIAGAGRTTLPTHTDLKLSIEELLTGMLNHYY